jgi:hypothetical protein
MKTRAIAAIGAISAIGAFAAPVAAQGTPPSTINVPPREPPPADRPLIKRVPKPSISVDGGAGVLGYINGTGRLGPAWNVRVTGEFTPRIAIEGNYVGASNKRADGTGTLTYTSLDADVRYNVLRADQAPVQPYLAAGLGYAGWFGPGGRAASLVIPLSAGVERMLTQNIKIGARFTLRPSFFDDLGYRGQRNPPGGDSWGLLANVGGAF